MIGLFFIGMGATFIGALIAWWVINNFVIKNDKEITGKIITELIEGFRVIGIILQPFLPIASKLLLDTLNIDNKLRTFEYLNSKNFLKKGHKLNEPKALFPRFE